MLKHVISSQQKCFAKDDLKQNNLKQNDLEPEEDTKISHQSMTEELQRKKRPLFNGNAENNNAISGNYARTELFQAGMIIEHVSQEQQSKDINSHVYYMPMSPAKPPENIKNNKTFTFTTFGK